MTTEPGPITRAVVAGMLNDARHDLTAARHDKLTVLGQISERARTLEPHEQPTADGIRDLLVATAAQTVTAILALDRLATQQHPAGPATNSGDRDRLIRELGTIRDLTWADQTYDSRLTRIRDLATETLAELAGEDLDRTQGGGR